VTAREYFESIRRDVIEVARMRQDICDRAARIGAAHGIASAASGTGGIGGGTGGYTLADREIDEELYLRKLRVELYRRKGQLDDDLEYATAVLYGRSGNGGLAKAERRSDVDPETDAFCVCAYYLMGYATWGRVATELASCKDIESGGVADWCRHRAAAAFAYINKVGMAHLMDS
jgi:hypothetical protein